ncbi:MAG TPA: serine/threonine-protein phosphatase [Candidatus Hydrogenedentes bacterium]|nr:serine/threonine-protein phosphatase [Candidatus Hydrogenedentota bacterium]
MRLDIGAVSDTGLKKDKNEDNYGVYAEATPERNLIDDGALLVVADGLGGHIGGEIASKLAVSVFADVLKQARPVAAHEETGDQVGDTDGEKEEQDSDASLHDLLREWIGRTNDNIYQTNLDLVKGAKPMGTTLLAALLEPGKAHIVNVGDSRAYHIRDGEIVGHTEDHSWVDAQVKRGVMTRKEAETDRRRNVVTRCLGTHPQVAPDLYTWDIQAGDMVLLATDGLTEMVPEEDMLADIAAGGSAQAIAERLVDHANANGGRDNITVIAGRIAPALGGQAAARAKTIWRSHGRILLMLIGMLLFGATCFFAGFFLRPFLRG